MFFKILAIVLSLNLIVPVGSAAERINQGAQGGADTTGVRQTGRPASVASNAQAKPPEPLSPEEDASLSARAEQPGPEVAGGALSNLHLTYAVIALAAIVLVLVLK